MLRTRTIALVTILLFVTLGPASMSFAKGGGGGTPPGPLTILLTNDDGYDSPGIQAMRAALLGAGHDVTVVAPLEQQSGKGGSISTDIGGFIDVIEESPGVWSVDSTPSDSVRAGLGVVMAGNRPDLVVSGSNFGQNLAMPGSAASGTVNAALAALFSDVPAIAVSVELKFSEAGATPIPFPSTFATFGPAADFTVRLIERLQATSQGGAILPPRTMLNVNVPAPYSDVVGVKSTQLARRGDFDIVFQDVLGVIPTGGGPVLLNIGFPPGPDPVPHSDTDAFKANYISITAMDGDMTSHALIRWLTGFRLLGLEP